MTNLDSVLKSRDITLLTKVHTIKAIIFPVVIHRCKSWTMKKAEHQRIDAFELWCWRRIMRAPWMARRSNQSILKKSTLSIHWKDWCWSSNTLATWYKEPALWKDLLLGTIEDRRRRGQQRMRWLDGIIIDFVDMSLSSCPRDSEGQGSLRAAFHGVTKSWTWLSDWTTTTNEVKKHICHQTPLTHYQA